MRVNVYSQEMTSEIEVVEKEAEGKKYVGYRIFLKSPDDLHHDADDDDRTSVTFWSGEGFSDNRMTELFARLSDAAFVKTRGK